MATLAVAMLKTISRGMHVASSCISITLTIFMAIMNISRRFIKYVTAIRYDEVVI
jgi:hypothetical protein